MSHNFLFITCHGISYLLDVTHFPQLLNVTACINRSSQLNSFSHVNQNSWKIPLSVRLYQMNQIKMVCFKCAVKYIAHNPRDTEGFTYVCPFSCEPIGTGSLQVTWLCCEWLLFRVTLCICNSCSLLWCTFHLAGLLSRATRYTALREEHNECLAHLFSLVPLRTLALVYAGK